MRGRRPGPLFAAACTIFLVAAGGAAHGAPIGFSTALPVAEGEGILRLQTNYLRAARDPGPADRDLRVWAFPVVGVYGATRNLALFAALPYLDKELKVDTPRGRRSREVSGVGDLRLFGRYTALRRDRRGETLRLAPFMGIEAPTGDHDEADSLGRLPRTVQLGSGSWDPFGGVILTWQTLAWQFDAAASYQHNTEADGFRFGDVARLDVSYQYRLWPRKLGAGVPAFVYGVVETGWVWQDLNEADGKDDPDSGGTTLFLSPGIQRVTRRTVLEAAVRIPLVQNLNGDALETDYALTLGFRWNF